MCLPRTEDALLPLTTTARTPKMPHESIIFHTARSLAIICPSGILWHLHSKDGYYVSKYYIKYND